MGPLDNLLLNSVFHDLSLSILLIPQQLTTMCQPIEPISYLIGDGCYVWIPKESRRGWEQRVKGQECVRLIAIDYHAATGTAGMEYGRLKVKDDQMAGVHSGLRQPYKRHKSEGDLEVEQEGQVKAM